MINASILLFALKHNFIQGKFKKLSLDMSKLSLSNWHDLATLYGPIMLENEVQIFRMSQKVLDSFFEMFTICAATSKSCGELEEDKVSLLNRKDRTANNTNTYSVWMVPCKGLCNLRTRTES